MFRTIMPIVLSLALLLASLGTAVARGAPQAEDKIVICSGTTVAVIFVDADGQPTTAPHVCPDCALHLFAALAPSNTISKWLDNVTMLRAAPAVEQHSVMCKLRASARSPPVDVIRISQAQTP
ncbi:hypothetical protein GCM10007385_31540 [Tateyamaria omphalii]|uniref:hypothetical protein n=1 Tax=Tateyamaria omphalii TaxID=299262 RepID=UPI00167306FC|nr:hypothetical protein [Tateyamaria omphalii]GGX59992.1 hypothetical protein GCM10007385_31540 [Tateyamaria omphalii]